jgi:hypothetical protein
LQTVIERLKQELERRGLTLVWTPKPDRLSRGDLVVFGAEQSTGGRKKPLIAGFGPGKFDEARGNSPATSIQDYQNRFLEALEAAGIPKNSLHSTYPHVGRGKIWPTFVARLTQQKFRKLIP